MFLYGSLALESRLVGYFFQTTQLHLAFILHRERRLLLGEYHGIGFQVAIAYSPSDGSRSLVDGYSVRNALFVRFPIESSLPFLLFSSQCLVETSIPPLSLIDVAADAFVAYGYILAHSHFLRYPLFQPPGNLFGRAACSQRFFHILSQFLILPFLQFPSVGIFLAPVRIFLRSESDVGKARALVSLDFPLDDGAIPPQSSGYPCFLLFHPQPGFDLLSFEKGDSGSFGHSHSVRGS